MKKAIRDRILKLTVLVIFFGGLGASAVYAYDQVDSNKKLDEYSANETDLKLKSPTVEDIVKIQLAIEDNERKKLEEERLAQEEAERLEAESLEAERLAQEEADRLAAEQLAQAEAESYVEESYYVDGNGLNPSSGVNYYNGWRETYYSSNVLYHYRTGEWTPDENGVYRDADGYVIVASSSDSQGSVVDTSFGAGKVYDTGCAEGTHDIYTNW